MLWTIILILLVLALVGGLGGPWNAGGRWYGTGVYGGGGLGIIIVILVVLLLMGRI